ncbi:hypothetical protein ACFWIX_06810 [Pseudarthrobacter sp. NPDC058362]|uniref:hypothetical protein n=1 Tax=Pseudarthrobacter sp. NPDC058362 TaxID=3346458 RepID=UPI0036598214
MTASGGIGSLVPPLRLRAAVRRGRKGWKRLAAHGSALCLRSLNLLSQAPVTGSAPVVVSMTTHGERIHTVSIALESIASGRVRPRRLLLWLDSEALMADRPAAVRRLESRGLEVLLTSNYGPHTKYYPYVAGTDHHTLPLVTADDDIIYPRSWLDLLIRAHHADPEAVHGHWVNVMQVRASRVVPYSDWRRARDTGAAGGNFALGVSGVIYPPAMLEELRRQGDGFLAAAPGADDIWLHRTALRAGIPVRQVRTAPRHFPIIPGSQESSLMAENVGNRRNDFLITGLYAADDILAIATNGDHQLPK